MEEGKRAVAGDVEPPLSLMPPAKWIGSIFDWASAHVLLRTNPIPTCTSRFECSKKICTVAILHMFNTYAAATPNSTVDLGLFPAKKSVVACNFPVL